MPAAPATSSTTSLWWKLGFIALVIAGCAYLAFPLDKKLTLGLDLQGGTYMDLQVELDQAVESAGERVVEGLRQELQTGNIVVTSIVQEEPGRIVVTGVPDVSRPTVEGMLDQRGASWETSWSGGAATLRLRSVAESELRANAARQVKETIDRRINEFGVREPLVQPQGDAGERIVLQLPGLDDSERVRRIITTASVMEFRLGRAAGATREQLLAASGGVEPSDAEVVQADAAAGLPSGWYLLDRAVVARGEDLEDARATSDRFGKPVVSFQLSPDAGRAFGEFTGAHIQEPLAIVIDDRVVTYATIQDQIFSSGQLTGSYGVQEVQDTALRLKSGGLPAKVTILHEQTVGPSLGRDSIRSGSLAGILGCSFIGLFMLVYYKGAGINAIIVLALNVLIVLAIMAAMDATLTLPGIAGLALTVGMAVDANIIIFERIREELAAGKSSPVAVDAGFDRAFSSILDANVTTLIAAFFLYNFGTGPIKGFAVTLMIGLLTSMFTAIFVSRALFELGFVLMPGRPLSIEWRKWRAPFFPFMRIRNIAMAVSAVVVLASIVIWATRGLEYGIDFAGGTQIAVKAPAGTSAQDLRDRLAGTEFADTTIQQFGKVEEHAFLLRIDDAAAAESEAVLNAGESVGSETSVAQQVMLALLGSDASSSGRLDVNSVGRAALRDELVLSAGLGPEDAESSANALVDARTTRGGLLVSTEEVAAIPGVSPAASSWLQSNATAGSYALLSAESVGPAVGSEMKGQATRAVIFSLLGILAYVTMRFEFRFAVGAVAATMHDVIVTVGFLALLGQAIDITVVAAILTVVGYSLNDTIVIFDRIREMMRSGQNLRFIQILDQAVNQTLSRTILTSALTFLSVIALLIWGGPVLRGFALALTIGIISGTLSTMFIATPIVLLFEKLRAARALSAEAQPKAV